MPARNQASALAETMAGQPMRLQDSLSYQEWRRGWRQSAFAIATLAGGIWSALLVLNLRATPAIPWSVPAMTLILWLAWSYLAGKGWPRSTAQARRLYLRANKRSGRTYLWAWLAGGLSVVALAGFWTVLFQLIKMPPKPFRGYVALSAPHGL
jgi:hypothetical protein